MKIKCDYCGSEVDDSLTNCPNCNAPLAHVNRTANGAPKTIEELKQWYKDRNLPDESITRFFIGKDVHEAKAFGIYKANNGDFVVYKNKSDGSRAVRYQGCDEAYAVNELYQKLKVEISDQKAKDSYKTSSTSNYSTRVNGIEEDEDEDDGKRDFGTGIADAFCRLFAFLASDYFFFLILLIIFVVTATRGCHAVPALTSSDYDYYDFGSGSYYNYDSDTSTYEWDDSYSGSSSDSSSSWWDDNDDWDWDSDYDWDSGSSWDSGGSDWDSDW